MTPGTFRTLIEGALSLWQVDARLRFDGDPLRCEVHVGHDIITTIHHEETALGALWRIERPGRSDRVHRSVAPALATLREAVCPERPRGRALFVTPAGDPGDTAS